MKLFLRGFASLIALALTSIFLPIERPNAQVVTGIVATATVGTVIGQLQGALKQALNQYRAEKDLLRGELMQEGLDFLDAWKSTNGALINQTFDRLDASTQKAFNKMYALIDDAKKTEGRTAADVKDITLEWSQIVSLVPLANASPTILDYSPRVVTPVGTDQVPLRVTGPNVGFSGATIKMPDGTVVGLNASTATTLTALVNRKALEAKASYESLELTYNAANTTGWFGFWGRWFPDYKKSVLVLWVLPDTVATYKLTTKIHQDKVSRSTFQITVGGQGRDNPYRVSVLVPDLNRRGGWKIDEANIGSMGVSDRGGDHGHCSGIWPGTLTANGFEYYMDLGHTTNNFGVHGDAHQSCLLTVPIVLHQDQVIDGPSSSGTLSWGRELPVSLPDQLQSFEADLKFFDGTSYVVTGDRTLPFASIRQNGNKLIFSPSAPIDF